MLIVVGSGTKTTDGTKQTLQAVTIPGPHRLLVDVNALVGGATPDIVELSVEQNVLSAGAERLLWSRQFTGGLVIEPIILTDEFWVPFTATCYIKRIQGTDRAYPWSLMRDERGDVLAGTVQSDAGNSATQFKTDLPSSTADFYKDAFFLFLTGALANGGPKKCSGYTTGKIVTVTGGFTGTPANGDQFLVINR